MTVVALLMLTAIPLVAAAPSKAAAAKPSARSAPAKKTVPVFAAPGAIPHTIAMFLTDLSRDGEQKVTYRATAVGTRLFFETGSNVTVYGYNAHENAYMMESFLPSTTLEAALRKYGAHK
jgi:hypothetical protein